jgi:CubicO group peptidase (beta-lactamase class C family)
LGGAAVGLDPVPAKQVPQALELAVQPPRYAPRMRPLPETVDSIADENGFAGVVSVHRSGEVEFARAYGLAHRAHDIPNTVDTRFAIASGSKGLTALAGWRT